MMTKPVNTVPAGYADGILSKLKTGEPVAICRHCSRVLTDPASVKAGIGPECAQKEDAGLLPGEGYEE